MLARLAFFFIVVPLLDLFILVQLGRAVGVLPTIALVVVTGVLGAALARSQGLRTVLEAQREIAAGRLPGRALLDGLAILVGGALLLTPGLLTDLLGLSLLFPPTRRWVQRWARRRLEGLVRSGQVQVSVLSPQDWMAPRPTGEPPLDPRHEIRPGDRE